MAFLSLVRRDPVMTAVASSTFLTIAATGIYVAGAMRSRLEPAAVSTVDCGRILRMIDDAFADRRMSDAETTEIEEASRTMRATATAASASAVARCVGLPRSPTTT
jgi:hypothetical protein